MSAAFAELRNITKTFGNVRANEGVTLAVEEGTTHALVGENGAGKSTLMKILYGMAAPDSGEILIRDRQVRIPSPRIAISLGIGMLHQHFMLIPPFSVTENIILGTETTARFGRLNLRAAEQEIERLSKQFQLEVDPSARIETLSIGYQQRVEILKILFRHADLLILDEPTPVLAPQEVERFFATIRLLKARGKTVILITHRLSEVMEISDTVTVMRRGKVVKTLQTGSTNPQELARLMVGDDAGPKVEKTSSGVRRPVLKVQNLSCINDRGLSVVRDVSFSVTGGEILGIAAVEGNGQSELVQVLTGLRPRTSGEIVLNEAPVDPGDRNVRFGYIPEDRIRFGMIGEFSVAENVILGRQYEREFAGNFLLRTEAIKALARRIVGEFDVRPPSQDLPAAALSGGNQQKVVVGRELAKNADFIVASQPTRGLDIRAIDFVHGVMIRERNRGKAILLVSSDLSELLSICDRIAVMYEGRITGIFSAADTSERELGLYMTGSQRREAAQA